MVIIGLHWLCLVNSSWIVQFLTCVGQDRLRSLKFRRHTSPKAGEDSIFRDRTVLSIHDWCDNTFCLASLASVPGRRARC
jgi:hypothetical protein